MPQNGSFLTYLQMKSHNPPQPDEHMPTRLAQNLGQCPHCSTCLSGKTEWTQHLRLGWLLYAPNGSFLTYLQMKSHNPPQPDEHMPTRLAQNLGQCLHCSTCLSGKTEWTQHLRLGWLLYAPKWVLSNLPPDEVTQPTSTRWTHAHQTGPESRTMPSLFNLSVRQDWMETAPMTRMTLICPKMGPF